MARQLPSFEEVSELLRLDAETGRLFWRSDVSISVKAEDEAGHLRSNGYVVIAIKRKQLRAHRVVFLLANGKWPSQQIDHINGIKSDNRPDNLRDISPSGNTQNQRKAMSTNKSSASVPGVCWKPSKGKWIASCRSKYVKHMYKSFATKEEAEMCVIEFRRANFYGNTL